MRADGFEDKGKNSKLNAVRCFSLNERILIINLDQLEMGLRHETLEYERCLKI